MEVREYVSVLRRHIALIALAIVVTVATAYGVTMLMEPEYRASTVLRLQAKAFSPEGVRQDSITFIERLTNTYAQIATSDEVAGQAARDLRFTSTPPVGVTSTPNTELLSVTVEASDAERAAQLANAVSERLIERVRELNEAQAREISALYEKQIDDLGSAIAADRREYNELRASGSTGPETETRLLELETAIASKQEALANLEVERQQQQLGTGRDYALVVVDPAEPPGQPSSPKPVLSIALGLLLGTVGGVGLAFLFENLNPRLRTTEEIATTASEFLRHEDDLILGRIPRDVLRASVGADVDGSFHRLRMALFGSNGRVAYRSLLVTSAHPREGKTSVVANLGASLARSGRRTVLVDADLRRPTLHTHFGLTRDVGLTNVLRGSADLDQSVQETPIRGLFVLASGPPVDDPVDLFEGDGLDRLRDDLGERFDAALIDAPPILASSDAFFLARAAEAVVLMVHPSRTGRDSLRATLTELRRLDSRFLGIVINGVKEAHAYD